MWLGEWKSVSVGRGVGETSGGDGRVGFGIGEGGVDRIGCSKGMGFGNFLMTILYVIIQREIWLKP